MSRRGKGTAKSEAGVDRKKRTAVVKRSDRRIKLVAEPCAVLVKSLSWGQAADSEWREGKRKAFISLRVAGVLVES